MDKDYLSARGKYDVGSAGQFLAVEPVSVAELVQKAAHDHLRNRILAPNPAHILAALIRPESIHGDPAMLSAACFRSGRLLRHQHYRMAVSGQGRQYFGNFGEDRNRISKLPRRAWCREKTGRTAIDPSRMS